MSLDGFKDFENGAPLLEGDLDNYLMSQVVMHFASTAARDAAITAPVEGMLVMVDGTYDVLYRYDGAAWTVWIARGSGTPEANVTAGIGAMYQRTDGSTGTTLYVKESGTGNTGWAAVGGSGTSGVLASVSVASSDYSTSSSSLADVDATNAVITFTAPASGNVIVILNGVCDSDASSTQSWGLRSGASDVAGSAQRMRVVNASTAGAPTRMTYRRKFTGLTPGTSYTWKWAWKINASTARLYTSSTGDEALMTVEAA